MSDIDYDKIVGYKLSVYANDTWRVHKRAEDINEIVALIYPLMKEDKPVKVERQRLIDTLWVVRRYCKFDGWFDVSGYLSKEEAKKLMKEKDAKISGGPVWADRYHDIFRANTRMLRTPESLGR